MVAASYFFGHAAISTGLSNEIGTENAQVVAVSATTAIGGALLGIFSLFLAMCLAVVSVIKTPYISRKAHAQIETARAIMWLTTLFLMMITCGWLLVSSLTLTAHVATILEIEWTATGNTVTAIMWALCVGAGLLTASEYLQKKVELPFSKRTVTNYNTVWITFLSAATYFGHSWTTFALFVIAASIPLVMYARITQNGSTH